MATTKGGRGGGRGVGGGPTVKPAGGKGTDGRRNLPGPSTHGGKGSAVGGGKLPASGGQGKLPASGESSKGPAVPSRKLPVMGKGKGISVDGGGEPSRRQQNRDGGGTPPGVTKSIGDQASSNSSNPSGPTTPLSQGTTSSQDTGSVSRTNLIPTQYPSTSNRSGSQRLAFPAPLAEQPPPLNLNHQPCQQDVQMAEEEDKEQDIEDTEEEKEEEEEEEEEDVEGQQLGPEYAAVDDRDDYQALLDNMFSLPGRQNLPLLTEVSIEIEGRKTLW